MARSAAERPNHLASVALYSSTLVVGIQLPLPPVSLGPLGGAGFGFKGAGLAGLAEMLSGVLTGMRLGTEQSGMALGDVKVGHFVMAIDPATFVAEAVFGERIATYLDGFKREPGTMPAGGPEWAKRRDRDANGVPVPEGLYEELREAAEKAGVELGI